MNHPLLKIEQLTKEFRIGKKTLHAVQNISFSLQPGEILGLGGESGCGKSTIGKMVMGLLEPTSGNILFEGKNLKEFSSQDSLAWRRQIQMIFQNPSASLNPRFTVEETLAEPFIIHRLAKGKERLNRIVELLTQVGLSEEHLKRSPHELSGGQKQRIAIARALSVEPRLLICDEPFSALDVSVQAQIINLLSRLQKEKQLSYLIISHDLSILRYLTHQLAIMYAGELMEFGETSKVYETPLHPYSQMLASSILSPDPAKERQRSTVAVKGDLPSLLKPSSGCPFYSRCPHAQKRCETVKPAWKEVNPNHFTACHLF